MSVKDMMGWLLLAAALAVGGLTYFMVRHYLSTQEAQIRSEIEGGREQQVKVVVAGRNLVPGDIVSSKTMAVGTLPKKHLSNRVVLPSDFEDIQNRVLSRSMSSGEPLLADFISGLLVERFSDLLEEGQRAVSLEVSALETHSGMLLPGDFVDLYVFLKPAGKGDQEALVPVLDRVKVLAAGPQPLRTSDQSFQPLSEDGSRYSLVTVAAGVPDAERLIQARNAGEMVYLLRNAEDEMKGFLAEDDYNSRESLHEYWYLANDVPFGEVRYVNPPEDNGPGGMPGNDFIGKVMTPGESVR